MLVVTLRSGKQGTSPCFLEDMIKEVSTYLLVVLLLVLLLSLLLGG